MLGLLTAVAAIPAAADNGWISGTVSDSLAYPYMGNAISGATVSTDTGGYSAQTNATGDYNMSVAPGNYTLKVTATGWLDGTAGPVQVTANNTTRKNVVLAKPTGNLTGKVTDTDDGSAVYPATVTSEDGLKSTLTDSSGKYTLTGLPVGSVNISVQGIGYPMYNFTVTITQGQTTTRDVQLKEISYVALTVKDSDGKAILGASVKIGNVTGTTDTDGKLTLEVNAGQYTLEITATGYKSFSQALKVDKGTITTAEATMVKPGTVDTGLLAALFGAACLILLLPIIIVIVVIVLIIVLMRRKKKAKATEAAPPAAPGVPAPSAPGQPAAQPGAAGVPPPPGQGPPGPPSPPSP